MKHAKIRRLSEDEYQLTLHNDGQPPRTVHRTRAGAILTLHYWGGKGATKLVDEAIDKEIRISL